MEPPLQRRFRSAAQYYLLGRPPYSSLLIRRVVQLCALNSFHRILDLGTGPGLLAMAFAPSVGEVTALDPEPEMLEIGKKNASSGHFKIKFVQGSSYDLGPQFGRFQAVTIGRAFHWMDRSATLHLLDAMIESDGAVVLFNDSHPEVPENSWHSSYEKLIERLQQVRPEIPVVLDHGEMPHALHDGHARTGNARRDLFGHLRRTRVVVFAGEQRNLAAVGVDALDETVDLPAFERRPAVG